jgi:group II intron reverse transcriptase/maturase
VAATATLGAVAAWPGLARVREAAVRDRSLRFTNLLHHVTPDLLRAAYRQLSKQAAAGVDGVTWQAYGADLEVRLVDLHDRLHGGRYRAQPARRVYIPKPDGRQRPLGIPALEDKVVQQALVWVLQAIFEADFYGFSYGFRPGKNCHDALDALYVAITQRKVSWILDADIRSFFDTVNHERLMEMLQTRVADPRILRLVGKFLRAGVSEEGQWSKTEVGTPQGGVISPLLANIYLHHVLDRWVQEWRQTKARGEVYIVRYADDFVVGFQYQTDAESLREALQARMREYGLELHAEKTRLIEFGRFASENRERRGAGKPETFDFLGFTHICGRKRSNGRFTVKRRTTRKRLVAKVAAVKEALKRRICRPLVETGVWLRAVMRGHLNYFAVPGNQQACNAFRTEVCRAWRRVLCRRSQNGTVPWSRFSRWIRCFIPSVRVLHPYPNQRLVV